LVHIHRPGLTGCVSRSLHLLSLKPDVGVIHGERQHRQQKQTQHEHDNDQYLPCFFSPAPYATGNVKLR
jgi:hypothetical protein